MTNCFLLYYSILISAFVGCGVAFGCFSAAAMLARRREYLYLGGLLSAGLSILFWLQFASSLFGGSTAIFKFEVYSLLSDNTLSFISYITALTMVVPKDFDLTNNFLPFIGLLL